MELFNLFLFLSFLHYTHPAILFQGKGETIKSLSLYLSRHPASYHHSTFHSPSTPIEHEHIREERSTNDERIDISQRLSPPSLSSSSNRLRRRNMKKRSISNAVIESAHCEHVDLVDCSEYSSDEMTCMLTATGMTCCVCTATLRQMNEWKIFGYDIYLIEYTPKTHLMTCEFV